jgi:hypothetical protein
MPVRVLAQQVQQLDSRDPWEIDVDHEQLDLHMAKDLSGCCCVVDDGSAPPNDVIEDGSDQLRHGLVILDYQDGQRLPKLLPHRPTFTTYLQSLLAQHLIRGAHGFA